jgi:hypothetical protein
MWDEASNKILRCHRLENPNEKKVIIMGIKGEKQVWG